MSNAVLTPVRTAAKLRLQDGGSTTAAGAVPSPQDGVSTRLRGVLDGRNRARVEATIADWCEVAPETPYARPAHLDLTEVTQLKPGGLDVLNNAYLSLSAAGWRFRVTPPEQLEARLAFNTAAIRRDLLWA